MLIGIEIQVKVEYLTRGSEKDLVKLTIKNYIEKELSKQMRRFQRVWKANRLKQAGLFQRILRKNQVS